MTEEQKTVTEPQKNTPKHYFDVESSAVKISSPHDLSAPVLDHRSLKQPLTHAKNKSLLQKYCCCIYNSKKTDLTLDQLEAFYNLKAECNVPLDHEKQAHNKLIETLWSALFHEPMGSQIPNPLWKTFGFQNIDPRTDFRGGGVISLKIMIHYAQTYPENIKRMLESKDDFIPSMSSIGITYFLLKYLHLADFLIYECDKKEICSRICLKNFGVFLLNDSEVLYKIHHLLFNDVFDLWNELKNMRKGTFSIPSFCY